jgi:hypothetical protein
LEEKRYHFSPTMIARLFGVPPEKKEPETNNKPTYTALARARTLKPESVLGDQGLTASQNVSETYFPARGVVTVGVLMSVIGLLLFSPVKLPSMYRYVGGICFFIMGISVIGSEILARVLEFLEIQEQ